MASMLTSQSVATSSTTVSITRSQRAHPIHASPIGPHSPPVSNMGSSHVFRSRTPQRMRLLSACRARTPLQETTNTSDINAPRQRSSPAETSSLLAPAVVLSPLFLGLVQPLAAAAAMQSIAVDQGSATATVLASGLTVAAAVGADQAGAHFLYELADMDAKTAGTLALILRPVLSITTLLMIVRIVLTWYPQLDGKKLPWAIAVAPTEPVLGPTRRAIPPIGGVDVAPIVWVAMLSFINEILLGPQGILNLLQRKAEF